MLQDFIKGNLKKKIIPGSDTRSTIPKADFEFNSQSGHDSFDYSGRDYVNSGLEENEFEEYQEVMHILILKINCVFIILKF